MYLSQTCAHLRGDGGYFKMIRGDDNDPKVMALDHQSWATVSPLVRPNAIYENDDSASFCITENPASCDASPATNPSNYFVANYDQCPVGTAAHVCDAGEAASVCRVCVKSRSFAPW